LRNERLRDSETQHEFDGDNEFELKMWYTCITDFTGRSIAVPTDRLPAVAGMAQKFAHPQLDAYLAGLWELNIFRGLSWITKGETYLGSEGERSDTEPLSELRSNENLAPSWSLATANELVAVDNALWWNPRESSTSARQEYRHWMDTYSPTLISHFMEHSSIERYLSVKERSYIEIKGFIGPYFCVQLL
jgi:hypothetical protein